MTNRIFDFGARRVLTGHGVIENAPCVFLHEGLHEDLKMGEEPSKEEIAALNEHGVILRFSSVDGAMSMVDAIINAVKHYEQVAAEEPAYELTEAGKEVLAEAELLEEPAFKSSRKTGYCK